MGSGSIAGKKTSARERAGLFKLHQIKPMTADHQTIALFPKLLPMLASTFQHITF